MQSFGVGCQIGDEPLLLLASRRARHLVAVGVERDQVPLADGRSCTTPCPTGPAAAPKYEKYPAAPGAQSVPPVVWYSWLPTAGWVTDLIDGLPHEGSYDCANAARAAALVLRVAQCKDVLVVVRIEEVGGVLLATRGRGPEPAVECPGRRVARDITGRGDNGVGAGTSVALGQHQGREGQRRDRDEARCRAPPRAARFQFGHGEP